MELRPNFKEIVYLIIVLIFGVAIICFAVIHTIDKKTDKHWIAVSLLGLAYLRVFYDFLFRLKTLIVIDGTVSVKNIITGHVERFATEELRYYSSDAYVTTLRNINGKILVRLCAKYYSNIEFFFNNALSLSPYPKT
jgi:hypothetical protein